MSSALDSECKHTVIVGSFITMSGWVLQAYILHVILLIYKNKLIKVEKPPVISIRRS